MATHDVTVDLPTRFVLRSDVTFVVRSDDVKLGELQVSKGSIDWLPGNGRTCARMRWEKFNDLMKSAGVLRRGFACTSQGELKLTFDRNRPSTLIYVGVCGCDSLEGQSLCLPEKLDAMQRGLDVRSAVQMTDGEHQVLLDEGVCKIECASSTCR